MRRVCWCLLAVAIVSASGFAACCRSGDSGEPEKPAASSAAPVDTATAAPDATTTVARNIPTSTASVSAWTPPGTTPFGSASVGVVVPPHGTSTATASAPPVTTTSTGGGSFGGPPPVATSNKKK